MTEEEITDIINGAISEHFGELTKRGMIPADADQGEVQQFYELYAEGVHDAIRQDKPLYASLLEGNRGRAEELIKGLIQAVDFSSLEDEVEDGEEDGPEAVDASLDGGGPNAHRRTLT